MVRLQCERVLFAVVSQHRYGNQSPKITDTAEPKFRVTILLERSIFRERLSPGCCSLRASLFTARTVGDGVSKHRNHRVFLLVIQ